MAEGRARVGTVKTANPSKREALIVPEPASRHEFADRDWLRIAAEGQPERRFKIESIRTDDQGVRVQFAPGVPRDTVAQLKGAGVYLTPEERRPRTFDTYTLDELLGMTVAGEDDESLGRVVEAYSAGGNDVLEVETESGDRFLFPVVAEAVNSIDFDAETIVVGDLTPFRVDHAD